MEQFLSFNFTMLHQFISKKVWIQYFLLKKLHSRLTFKWVCQSSLESTTERFWSVQTASTRTPSLPQL